MGDTSLVDLEAKQADERDHTWEIARPEYRVYFFELSEGRGVEGTSYRTDTYAVTGGSFEQVRNWADEESKGRAVGIAVFVPQGSEAGLVWVYGEDQNASGL